MMGMNMHQRFRLRLGLAALVFTLAGMSSGSAADKPLIWQPTKNSDTSYRVKLGLRLPMELEPEAGLDLGLDTTASGAAVSTPVILWSHFKAQSIQRPAYEIDRNVGFEVDRNAATATISVNAYEKRIATSTIDVEREGRVAVRYDAAAQQWAGVNVSQSVRIAKSDTGTAVVVRASATESFSRAGAGFGLEQKIGPHMTLSGTVDGSSDSSAAASFNASYRFTW
jgi:hypothetical protein